MGQYEILELLKQIYPNGLTTTELMKTLKLQRSTISNNARKLLKYKEIKCKQIKIQGKQQLIIENKYYAVC